MKQTLKKLIAPFKNSLTVWVAISLFIVSMQPTRVMAAMIADASVQAPVSDPAEEPAQAIVPPTVQDVLLDVCVNRGYDEACAKHLLGMLWKESNNKATAEGDYNAKCRCYLALGYFQIHYRMHGITAACATNLACSANWTLDYLEKNSYPKYVKYAIQCHNGCDIPNGYAASALRHGQRLWKTPLAITPASNELASNN